MPGSSNIRAGGAHVELTLKDTAFYRGLSMAQAGLARWGKALTSVGTGMQGLGVGAMKAAVLMASPMVVAAKTFADVGSAVKDMADRTGLGIEQVQELAYAARMSGTDMETLETAMRKLQDNLQGASEGSEQAQNAFQRLGISAAELKALSGDQQLSLIADRVAAIQDPAKRTAALLDIFGKSGTKLLPMLADGSRGLSQLRARAREVGVVLSTEDVQAAEEFGDALQTTWDVIKVATARLGSVFRPVFAAIADGINLVAKVTGNWFQSNQEVVLGVGTLVTVLGTAGAALWGLGASLRLIGYGFSAFSVIGTLSKGAFALLVAGGQVAIGVLTALISPIGLVAVAVGGLAGYAAYASGAFENMASTAGAAWSGIQQSSITAIGGIRDAIATGDFALAGQIAWAGLKAVWQEGFSWLSAGWLDFKTFFIRVGVEAVYGLAGWLTKGFAAIQVGWAHVCSFFQRMWVETGSAVKDTWKGVQTAISKAWVGAMKKLGVYDEATAQGADEILTDELNKSLAASEAQRKAKLNQIETEKGARLQSVADEESGTLAALNEDKDRRMAGYEADRDAKRKANREEIESAKGKLKDLTDKSKAAAEEKRDQEKAEKTNQEEHARQEDAKTAAKKQQGAIGTFSAQLAAMMIGGSGGTMGQAADLHAAMARVDAEARVRAGDAARPARENAATDVVPTKPVVAMTPMTNRGPADHATESDATAKQVGRDLTPGNVAIPTPKPAVNTGRLPERVVAMPKPRPPVEPPVVPTPKPPIEADRLPKRPMPDLMPPIEPPVVPTPKPPIEADRLPKRPMPDLMPPIEPPVAPTPKPPVEANRPSEPAMPKRVPPIPREPPSIPTPKPKPSRVDVFLKPTADAAISAAAAELDAAAKQAGRAVMPGRNARIPASKPAAETSRPPEWATATPEIKPPVPREPQTIPTPKPQSSRVDVSLKPAADAAISAAAAELDAALERVRAEDTRRGFAPGQRPGSVAMPAPGTPAAAVAQAGAAATPTMAAASTFAPPAGSGAWDRIADNTAAAVQQLMAVRELLGRIAANPGIRWA